MSGLENLNARLNYRGGNQEQRFQKDKVHGLSKALLYAYQDATIALLDENGEKGDRFRALINPDKNSGDYDNKIISIKYKDINLNKPKGGEKTSKGEQVVNIQSGSVFFWEETQTYWLVYLRYLEEKAYFRAQIRRCDQQVEINGKKYWTYIRGPMETSIPWNQKGGVEWNDMNYSLVMYVTKDSNTIDHFHRFAKAKVIEEITGIEKTWQVVGVNPYYGDGIIEVYLDEYFENSIEEARVKEALEDAVPEIKPEPSSSYINGPSKVMPYDEATYTIINPSAAGSWYAVMDEAKFLPAAPQDKNNNSAWTEIQKTEKLTVEQITASSVNIKINVPAGNFTIFYKTADEEISLNVVIK